MMSAQSLASFCCSRKNRWCSWHCEPVDRALDRRGPALAQPGFRAQHVEEGDRDEPPRGGIDAAEVPEIGLGPLHVDELGELSVRRLVGSERRKPDRRRPRSRAGSPDTAIAERTDRRVAAEDRAVAALVGRAPKASPRGCPPA